MEGSTDIYERFNLYDLPDRFCIEPRGQDGSLVSDSYLEIDRNSNEINLRNIKNAPIPATYTELRHIHGIVGTIRLVAGYALIVIKSAHLVGILNGHEIWEIDSTELLPYIKNALYLNEKQVWYNRQFTEMIQLVLATKGFYFSRSFDLSHSLQWLSENTTPMFRQLPMMGRADTRFVWNQYLSAPIASVTSLYRYALPIIHGFVGVKQCFLEGHMFSLILISRRSVQRAGTRFYMRGVDHEGHSANFVETEQILQYDKDGNNEKRYLTSLVQTRGSIPLFWAQRPNLHWQPDPTMKPTDDQVAAYVRHMKGQQQIYGGRHVIVNLVNRTGRERRVGGELERVSLQANLDFVRHNPFDFHHECGSLSWERLETLKNQLRPELTEFGFFASCIAYPNSSRQQTGFFRTNCMDCLDRTNVVQAVIAKESVKDQLTFLGIITGTTSIDNYTNFMYLFKNLWADNGDVCSLQYAGTGALKADYTRLGKRTVGGVLNDAMNSITRYFRNNFYDGYRQDAIDLFLGNFIVDPDNLPQTFETTILSFDYHGAAIVGAIFAGSMIIMCVLIAENSTATIFWLIIFLALMMFIFLNGEEFVNTPKLKQD
ncbi:hypothetical protein AB6A40_007815 [Gnathostoma spinigerum]|uniref:Phosphatidylinositol-3-phosphatase SAC1 n=1 Tax=Gnathostoma spinigerum TaxID=75299 RepID=A0ABD6EPB1_9BILA